MADKEKSKIKENYLNKDNNTKFTEEEMGKLKELQSNFWKIHSTFGQLTLAKIRLEQQIEDIDKLEETNRQNYFDHQSSEKDFVDSITKKYGEGTLDPSSGMFISNQEK
tara:strand:+ start:908 stop:1234 length:327 start_codon:yes stop_codon:yes gene_type:complete